MISYRYAYSDTYAAMMTAMDSPRHPRGAPPHGTVKLGFMWKVHTKTLLIQYIQEQGPPVLI